LAFFCLLTEDLHDLSEQGAESITFKDIEESAMILRGKKSFTKDCEKLAIEIRDFLKNFNKDHGIAERQLHLSVEK
jgi:hypothetical protein